MELAVGVQRVQDVGSLDRIRPGGLTLNAQLMHGISPQQFAESVSSFLVPFYIALAAMNGIAAYLMWQKFEPRHVLPHPDAGLQYSRSPTR